MTDERSAMQTPVRPEWLPFPYPAAQPRRSMFAVRVPGPPQSVRVAVLIMVGQALAVPLSLLVAFQRRDAMRDTLLTRFPELESSTAATLITVVLVAATVAAGLHAICYLYLAVRVRRGGNTARVVAVALAVLGIVGECYAAARTGSPLLQGAILADMACNVVIIVLLTVTDSWDYANRFRVTS